MSSRKRQIPAVASGDQHDPRPHDNLRSLLCVAGQCDRRQFALPGRPAVWPIVTPLRQEPLRRTLQHLAAPAAAVLGGDELAADRK